MMTAIGTPIPMPIFACVCIPVLEASVGNGVEAVGEVTESGVDVDFKLGVVEEFDGRVGNDVKEGSSELAVANEMIGPNAVLVVVSMVMVKPSTSPAHVEKPKKSTKADIAETGNSEPTMREVLAKVYGVARVIAAPNMVTHRPLTWSRLVIEYAVNTIEVGVCVLEYDVSVVIVRNIVPDSPDGWLH